MGWIVIVFVASVAWLGSALPLDDSALVRAKRASNPGHMMFGGYMRAQQSQGYNYDRPAKRFDPYARMASGSLPPGSSYGVPSCGRCDQEENKDEPSPLAPPTVQEEPEQEVTPTKKPKAPRMAKPVPAEKEEDVEDEDEEEDKEEEKPVSKPRRKTKPSRGPTYRDFFPMMFVGSSGKGRSSDDEGGYNPGASVAIANSFSTGEGAVASSRAVAYGSPDPERNRKSSPSRYRS